MHEFACEEIFPGCPDHLRGATVDQLVDVVERHARQVHHFLYLTPEMVAQVRSQVWTLWPPRTAVV